MSKPNRQRQSLLEVITLPERAREGICSALSIHQWPNKHSSIPRRQDSTQNLKSRVLLKLCRETESLELAKVLSNLGRNHQGKPDAQPAYDLDQQRQPDTLVALERHSPFPERSIAKGFVGLYRWHSKVVKYPKIRRISR